MKTIIYTEEANVERLDDIPLLLALQQRIGLAEVIDGEIPRHWLHRGLSIGDLIVVWNTFITYRNEHELLDKIKYYLTYPGGAERVRQAGRRRVLDCHTYQRRFHDLFEELDLV
jgi:hypothetical protein